MVQDLWPPFGFNAALREASAQVDMVIIDPPPVVRLADGALIASIYQDVMFIVESGKTRTSRATSSAIRPQAHMLSERP